MESIESFQMLDFSSIYPAGIPADTWIALCAALFLLFCIGYGYKRGIILQMAALIAGCATAALMYMSSDYLNPVLIRAFNMLGDTVTAEQAAWLAGLSLTTRIGRAVVYVLIGFFVYKIVIKAVRAIGSLFRKMPVLGFLSAVLGAVSGCVCGAAAILIFQIVTGVNVTGAVLNTMDSISHLYG